VIRLLTGGLPAFARQRPAFSSSAGYGEVSPKLRILSWRRMRSEGG